MSAQTPTITRLGEILRQEGRSVAWLAREVGVARSTMYQHTKGLHVPDDRRAAIADALGRSVEDVFGESR
jgi:DNA-binding XRE family transcriptional regulator